MDKSIVFNEFAMQRVFAGLVSRFLVLYIRKEKAFMPKVYASLDMVRKSKQMSLLSDVA